LREESPEGNQRRKDALTTIDATGVGSEPRLGMRWPKASWNWLKERAGWSFWRSLWRADFLGLPKRSGPKAAKKGVEWRMLRAYIYALCSASPIA
jgi:hypothetical protein